MSSQLPASRVHYFPENELQLARPEPDEPCQRHPRDPWHHQQHRSAGIQGSYASLIKQDLEDYQSKEAVFGRA